MSQKILNTDVYSNEKFNVKACAVRTTGGKFQGVVIIGAPDDDATSSIRRYLPSERASYEEALSDARRYACTVVLEANNVKAFRSEMPTH